jgi:hypothetical protein
MQQREGPLERQNFKETLFGLCRRGLNDSFVCQVRKSTGGSKGQMGIQSLEAISKPSVRRS